MAAPGTKRSIVKGIRRERRLGRGCWYLDWKQGSSGKAKLRLEKNKTERTEKVLSNALPGCFYDCEDSITTDSKVENLIALSLLNVGPGILVYTAVPVEKFARRETS